VDDWVGEVDDVKLGSPDGGDDGTSLQPVTQTVASEGLHASVGEIERRDAGSFCAPVWLRSKWKIRCTQQCNRLTRSFRLQMQTMEHAISKSEGRDASIPC